MAARYDRFERESLRQVGRDMPGWVAANRAFGHTMVRYMFRSLAERHGLTGYRPL